jgi:hypothetical protein
MKPGSFFNDYHKYRWLEAIPALCSWGTLVGAVVLTFVTPLTMVYVIIAYDFYWMVKVAYVSTFLVISFFKYRATMRTDWVKKVRALPAAETIHHLIFIPNASESLAVVESTFKALANTSFPAGQLWIIFAAEARFPSSIANGHAMQKKYGNRFGEVIVTVHPDKITGELAAKGANLAWAGREVQKLVDERGLAYDQLIVTVLDVDSCVERQYFDYLTYTFLSHPDRLHTSYQPIPMFNNNIWDSPAIMRVAATGTTFWSMSEQVRPERLLTFSSHSMPWQALVDVDFWQTDVVSDDSRIFLQCFLRYDGHYSVTPLHMPIYMDTVLSDNIWKSLRNLFKQQQRWGWGSENIPFMIWQFRHAKQIKLRDRLHHIFIQLEGHWSWATASIIIFFLGYVPLRLVTDQQATAQVATIAPQLLQIMLTIANIGLILSVILGTLILPRRPKHYSIGRYASMILQWLLLPISTIAFGSIPALSAQTRLLLGKYLGFYVTEKTRRS